MVKLKHISMQVKLIVFFFILAAVLLFSVNLLFFRGTKNAINSSKEAQLMILSQETANKIDRFLVERYGDIEVMAKSPLLKSQTLDDRLKQEYLENVINAYQTYDYIFIANEMGEIEISSGDTSGDTVYRQWLGTAMKGNTVISDFVYDKKDGAYKVYFAAPIVYEDGKIHGVVVEKMNFNAITDIVKKVRPGAKGYGYLLEANGSTIYHPSKETVSIEKAILKNEGIFYSDQKQGRYVSAFAPIKKYPNQSKTWYMVIEEPTKEAFAVTDQLRSYTVVVIVIAVLISFVMAVLLSKMITRPIRRLVKETQNIVEGNISQNLQIESSDEIGSLAKSFNSLLENLKSMMQQVLVISGEAASMAEIRQYTDKFFDTIPCAIITIDNSGRITTFNHVACYMTGLTLQEVNGKNIEEDFPAGIMPVIRLMTDTLQKGSIYLKHIMPINDVSGKEIPIVINTSIQKDENGKVLGVVGVFRKLEEIQQLEESVIRANNLKSLGTLSAGMAHEIRNPLTSIKGYAQYIRLEIGDNKELLSDITIIINEVDRLNGIIDRFLTFARPRQLELEPSDINEVIRGVLKLIRMEAMPDNIQLITKLETVPLVSLDKEQMGQAVLNVVLNAIQAMPQGGILEINTQVIDKPGYVEIQINDSGIGIALEDNDKIFEPFFTTKNKGTGLGLAICSRIIENHKGFIEVNSAPGLGTKFIIKLPIQ